MTLEKTSKNWGQDISPRRCTKISSIRLLLWWKRTSNKIKANRNMCSKQSQRGRVSWNVNSAYCCIKTTSILGRFKLQKDA